MKGLTGGASGSSGGRAGRREDAQIRRGLATGRRAMSALGLGRQAAHGSCRSDVEEGGDHGEGEYGCLGVEEHRERAARVAASATGRTAKSPHGREGCQFSNH